jgi:hypothetical protein
MGSLRRAFAGHGTLIKHQSWMLEGKQAQIISVRQTIFDKMRERNLDGAKVSLVNLIDQGLVDERRDYIMTRRKSTTVFIYTTSAGDDLYISRATTVQPGFSLLRVIILILGVLGIIVPFVGVFASVAALSGGGQQSPSLGAAGGLLFWGIVLIFFTPFLLWALVLALSRSIVSQVFDGDFLVLLRPSSLTEFQRDEVALMEHTTDDVVQKAMKQLGLNADKITPPSDGYQPKSRIRLI